jgi:hypothetical protein
MEQDPGLEERLKALGTQPIDGGLGADHLARMAGAVRSSRRRAKVRVAGAVVAGCLVATSGLAAAGALPDPAQHLAHRAFDGVGVGVPDPERYHGPECGPDVKKNHGAYVRADHDLATSQCGKKTHAGQDGKSADDEDEGSSNADAPCEGPPPWAGKDKESMSPEAKAKAQAERAATCGDEDDADEDGEVPAAPERQATTSTTTPSTTTTTVETTTTTTGSTTTETTAPTGA